MFLVVLCLRCADGFYVPGVAPQDFSVGDSIEVRAIKMTSSKTQLPFEYYSLPFCQPKSGSVEYKSQNLGEILRGDRITNTAYDLNMDTEVKCKVGFPFIVFAYGALCYARLIFSTFSLKLSRSKTGEISKLSLDFLQNSIFPLKTQISGKTSQQLFNFPSCFL